MRIIAGSYKGFRLQSVPGNRTRPTTDRVKEAMFSMLYPLPNRGVGLDLYAGSGALGIEALSRGLERVIFVDVARQAVRTIRTNLKQTKLTPRAEVYINEASRALQALIRRKIRLDIVWLDPPYEHIEEVVEHMYTLSAQLLQDDAKVVVESDKQASLPAKIKHLVLRHTHTYGNTYVWMYEQEGKT